jgi:hypothetical protein
MCLFGHAHAQLDCARTGRNYPLTTLRTEERSRHEPGTNRCRHAGCGEWPAAASRRGGDFTIASQSRPTQGTMLRARQQRYARGTKDPGGTGRRLTGPRAAIPASRGPEPARVAVLNAGQHPWAMAAAVSQRSPSGSTQSHQAPQKEGAALQEGTTWADSRGFSANACNLLSTGHTRRLHPSRWLALRGLALQGCGPTAPARINHTSSILALRADSWVRFGRAA